MTDSIGTATASLPPAPADPASRPAQQMWEDGEGPSFGDLLDIINPLQHLPVISTIYRAITGDAIGLGARLAGGALFGGPIGIVLSGATAALEEATGGPMSDRLAALFRGDEAPAAAPVAVAAATPPAARRPGIVEELLPPPGRDAELGAEAGERAPERARLAAQHAETRLLFARLAAGQPKAPAAAASEDRRDRPGRAAHPLMPPPDAPPEWYLQAMERAFRKYHGRGREPDQAAERRAFGEDRSAI